MEKMNYTEARTYEHAEENTRIRHPLPFCHGVTHNYMRERGNYEVVFSLETLNIYLKMLVENTSRPELSGLD